MMSIMNQRLTFLPICLAVFLFACKQKNTPEPTAQPAISHNQQAANLLIDAREQNQLIELPDSLTPQSLEEGYAIQDEIIKSGTWEQKGWKVAITNDALLEKAGIKEPVSGPLFGPWFSAEPMKYTHAFPSLYGFEFELAFQMEKDLPMREQDYTVDEVKAAVKSMHLAIEPVGSRYKAGPVASGVALFAADHAGNYSFVHSPAIEHWEDIDLESIEVVGYFDDKEVGRQTGDNVLGNPLNSLTWLANQLQDRGYHLKAGDWVTTGAIIGPVPVKPPVHVRGDFGDLGSVHVDFVE